MTATTAAQTAAAQSEETTHTVLRAKGFSCPSCVRKIEKALDALPGVTGAQVHFETQRIEVDHDPQTTTAQDLVEAVAKVGYTARPSAF